MTADPTPPQSGSASDVATTLLTLLAQGEQDHRTGRIFDAQAVDDVLRAHLTEGRRAR